MPQIIMGPTKYAKEPDGSVKGKIFTFLSKLSNDDKQPGLHIEPIKQAADKRVRTGRVDKFWRAVLFRVESKHKEVNYVYVGVLPHDDAIELARKAQLRVNSVNGIAELLLVDEVDAIPAHPRKELDGKSKQAEPLFVQLGLTQEELTVELGLPGEVVELAMECDRAEDITELAQLVPGWQGVALIDLSAGHSVSEVRETLSIELKENAPDPTSDSALEEALYQPASRLQFAFIEDDEELRQAVEDENFAAWRVFLHPEQRKYAERSWNGSFRLSGGAGTGKTVVLLHRARNIARRNPDARIVLTTFSKTLAETLQRDLKLLDPSLTLVKNLGDPGVFIRGVDSIARGVVQSSSAHLSDAVEAVLGVRSSHIGRITRNNTWKDAIVAEGDELPADLSNPGFFEAEYDLVVLPNRIKNFEEYAKVRRPGRGVPLDRKSRTMVWKVIEAYRLDAELQGGLNFDEVAAIGSEVLNRDACRMADHVLVDEGQDLNPTRWQFLRALVEEGPDDLFIAEDAHQRIYGSRVVLGHYGIKIVGRSQRLRLNYRTTAQNLQYALSVLAGTDFVDLEGDSEEDVGYRSARTGPVPQLVQAKNLDDEFDQIARIVGSWQEALQKGQGFENLGILVRTEQVGEQVVRALEERGVSARFVSEKSVPSGRPVVMTMHRAKGMEFARVIIFGVDDSSLPAQFAIENLAEADRADALQREKSLLYVATTRARDELVIVWQGEASSLLPVEVSS